MGADSAKAPLLATPRLELTPFAPEHVTFLHALWADPDVRRYLWDDRVIDRAEAAAVVESSIESFRQHGFGMWIACVRPEGVPAGFCGLRHFGDPPEVELLYGLLPAHWGRGLATEAARAVLGFAFGRGLARVFAGTDPPNAASMRVIGRLGMRYHDTRRIGAVEAVYYALDAADFAPS